MTTEYKVNTPITVDQFTELLSETALGERRPLNDRECLQGMLENSNLTITAWDDEKLVGIARSVTDFHFACFLSDLAVHPQYQKAGIGKKLQTLTQEQLGAHCNLTLIAAPAAVSYYENIGFTKNERCWELSREKNIC
jgi:ribosomal protein S18 acetylase RimI-like enzyme